MTQWQREKCGVVLAIAMGVLCCLPATIQAETPVVKTVPWVATNPLIPHDTWSGKTITLKGTASVQGTNFEYTWDFGDGSPIVTGTVTDRYAIQAPHAYTGVPGTVVTARLSVRDNTTGESGSRAYYVVIQNKSLDVEVNVAIDEGLWYLHKSQRRFTTSGVNYGDWRVSLYGGYAAADSYAISALNINAFEVNGHLESGSADNPYTETVARGLKSVFNWLTAHSIGSQTNGLGTFNPDTNGNGSGVMVNQYYAYYQGGMLMDAIIASGTPTAVTTTGPAGIVGRTYRDVIQDMADEYCWAQFDGSPGGGWRYNANEFPDNSACQWGAIGLIPAQRVWNCTVPQIVKDWSKRWLEYSHHPDGFYGYTSTSAVWGPYATTPSGMVQCAMDGLGRGNERWDLAETFMRNKFCNDGGPGNAVRDYYYGLFSFVKAMLLHDSNDDGVAEPIQMLQSSTPGVGPIDWYVAEVVKGDPCDGVARTLVSDQSSGGYWWGHNYSSGQYPMETAMAIIMLHRTIFEAGAPVSVAQAIPNPGVVGQNITLDGSGSFHQDPGKTIDSWEWDLDNDGQYDDATGPIVVVSFPSLGSFVVGLRVTDDATPEAADDAMATVAITTPPVPPTADAGGPYALCPFAKPWFLDASGSNNPDEGVSEPGLPGDTIQEYAWDLDGDGQFDDAFGPAPDVTAFFDAKGPGGYLVQLRVTDKTATSFPSSGMVNLTDTDSAQVVVKSGCVCVNDLVARAKDGKVQLVWTYTGAPSYNVYRSTVSGGPYQFLANTTSTYSTYLDSAVINNTTYYYVVREVALNTNEICQSNEASATPTARVR